MTIFIEIFFFVAVIAWVVRSIKNEIQVKFLKSQNSKLTDDVEELRSLLLNSDNGDIDSFNKSLDKTISKPKVILHG